MAGSGGGGGGGGAGFSPCRGGQRVAELQKQRIEVAATLGRGGGGGENRDPRDLLLADDAARRLCRGGRGVERRAEWRTDGRASQDEEDREGGGMRTVEARRWIERNGRVGGSERGIPRRRVFPGAPGAKVRERDVATPFPRDDVVYNRATSTSTATTASTTTSTST